MLACVAGGAVGKKKKALIYFFGDRVGSLVNRDRESRLGDLGEILRKHAQVWQMGKKLRERELLS